MNRAQHMWLSDLMEYEIDRCIHNAVLFDTMHDMDTRQAIESHASYVNLVGYWLVRMQQMVELMEELRLGKSALLQEAITFSPVDDNKKYRAEVRRTFRLRNQRRKEGVAACKD